jgi:exonuclease III
MTLAALAAAGAAARSEEPKRTPVRIATYNIRSGRAGRLEAVLRAMKQMNVDIGLLTEAKLTDGIHTRYSSGYNVFATRAKNHSQGGVVLFYRDSLYWQIESIKRGPQRYQLFTDDRKPSDRRRRSLRSPNGSFYP